MDEVKTGNTEKEESRTLALRAQSILVTAFFKMKTEGRKGVIGSRSFFLELLV